MSLLYTPDLVTLDYVREHRDYADYENTHDPLLVDMIHEASQEFAEAIERLPVPYTATRTADYSDPYLVELPDDLLALTTFTNGDGETIAGASFALRPSNEYPKRELALKVASGERLVYVSDFEEAFSLAGIWGYVPHYPTCWKDSGVDVPGGNMTSSATTLTLTTTAAFEVLQYIRVDSEIMQITAKTATVLTLTRGELGTTAAAHLAEAGLYQFQQRADIMGAVRAMAVYKYLNKDKIGTRVTVYDGGVIQTEDLDPQVYKTVERHWRNPGVAGTR